MNTLTNPAYGSPSALLTNSAAPAPAVQLGANPDRRFEDALRNARQREPSASAPPSDTASTEHDTTEQNARQSRLAARHRLRMDATAAAANRPGNPVPAREGTVGQAQDSTTGTAFRRDALARTGGVLPTDAAQKSRADEARSVANDTTGRVNPADTSREATERDRLRETPAGNPLQPAAAPEPSAVLVQLQATAAATDGSHAEPGARLAADVVGVGGVGTSASAANATPAELSANPAGAWRTAEPSPHPDAADALAGAGQDTTATTTATAGAGTASARQAGHAGPAGHPPGAGWSAILAQMSPVAAQAEALAERAASPSFATAGAGEQPLVTELGSLGAPTPVPGTPGLAGSELRGPLPGASTATSTTAGTELLRDTLEPAVESPAFAAALGSRIAWMARDGLERAQLDVHPADLGPVSVQLTMDGAQVRVDLTSEASVTRQVLEQSLPSLASALREAGFTLAGGGVFQQPQDRPGRETTAEPGQRPGSTEAVSGTAAGLQPLAPARRQGLVDLFA
jgi:flagellar hook-length control protein FliK